LKLNICVKFQLLLNSMSLYLIFVMWDSASQNP